MIVGLYEPPKYMPFRGKEMPDTASRTELFARGLIATNDDLRQINIVTNAFRAKIINNMKQVTMAT